MKGIDAFRRKFAGLGRASETISKNGEIIDLGAEHDIIQKSGSWYSYGGAKIAQGREGAKQFLDDNPEVAHELELKIKEGAGRLSE